MHGLSQVRRADRARNRTSSGGATEEENGMHHLNSDLRIRFSSLTAGDSIVTLLQSKPRGPKSEKPAMETRRLRTLIDPRQTRVLLDSYILVAGSLPQGALQQLDLAQLPLAFLDRAEQAEAQGLVWSAWTYGGEAWLFVGQLNLQRSRERGQPVLEIETYVHERRIKSRRVVLRSPDGTWQLLSD